jgi:excisionase family DNA binding protein
MARANTGSIEILTIPEAAARLKCSRGTVYNLIAAGDLDVTDIAPTGSTTPKTRVLADSLDALLRSRIANARRLRATG